MTSEKLEQIIEKWEERLRREYDNLERLQSMATDGVPIAYLDASVKHVKAVRRETQFIGLVLCDLKSLRKSEEQNEEN